MKVLALTADIGSGVDFYRMSEPARVAADLGVDIKVDDGIDADVTIDPETGFTTVHEVFTDADLIIIQRPVRQAWTSILAAAKRQGIATIVEIDDDYDSIHKLNLAYKDHDPTEMDNPHWVREACKVADRITGSTPALEKYGYDGRFSVLRNCVPESALSITPNTQYNAPVIGWSGTVQTHPTDLQATKGAVGQVIAKNKLPLGIVGDGEDVLTFLELPWQTPVNTTGWVPREDYLQAMADTMTIGIVPLEISPFNQAKSALKGIEMAALGIPFVASNTREYERLEAYGIGKTAKGPGDWRRHLQRLIDRPAERDKLSKQYRETLYNEGMTYEASAHQWVAVWEQAVEYRKSHHG